MTCLDYGGILDTARIVTCILLNSMRAELSVPSAPNVTRRPPDWAIRLAVFAAAQTARILRCRVAGPLSATPTKKRTRMGKAGVTW